MSSSCDPCTSRQSTPRHDGAHRAPADRTPTLPGHGPEPRDGALGGFDAALQELTEPQRRALRLLLTGARVALVSGAAGESRRVLDRWLGNEHVYLAPLRAVQRDVSPPERARLHAYITHELMWENDEGLDAEAWATLAVIRALGRLDAETDLLDRSFLRTELRRTGDA